MTTDPPKREIFPPSLSEWLYGVCHATLFGFCCGLWCGVAIAACRGVLWLVLLVTK